MARATAKFVSVSQEDIEDRIIAYFAQRFPNIDPAAISAGTDLKQLFNFNDAAWAGLAETFSDMAWMKQIGVRIAQAEMTGNTTVGKLVALIWKKVPKLVATGTGVGTVSLLPHEDC